MNKEKILNWLNENSFRIFLLFLIILFLISFPAIYQNSKNEGLAIEETKYIINYSKMVCDSNCEITNGDVIPGLEREAQLYCLKQCANNMKGIRESIIKNNILNVYTNNYNRIVGQIFCILGLRCSPLILEDFIRSYK